MELLPIVPPPVAPLEGGERFSGLDADVGEFWRFAMSDLKANTVRGLLAEFLISRAVGLHESLNAWGERDLVWEGITINVKSSAYLQAWPQRSLSKVAFSGLYQRANSAETNTVRESPDYHSDVYAVAAQTSTTHQDYNRLDVTLWDFYVLPQATVRAAGWHSLTLGVIRTGGAQRVAAEGLRSAIRAASEANGSRPKRWSLPALRAQGFVGFVPFDQLPRAHVPTAPGVYIVLRTSEAAPTFQETSRAGWFHQRDPSVLIDSLAAAWVPKSLVVYIGKASAGSTGRRGLRNGLMSFDATEPATPLGIGAGVTSGNSRTVTNCSSVGRRPVPTTALTSSPNCSANSSPISEDFHLRTCGADRSCRARTAGGGAQFPATFNPGQSVALRLFHRVP